MDADLERKARDTWDAYMAGVTNYLQHTPASKKEEEFCRDLEDLMGISEQETDDFRRMIAAFFFQVYFSTGKVTWNSNPRLTEAIIQYLNKFPFENVPVVPHNSWLGVTGKYRSIDDE